MSRQLAGAAGLVVMLLSCAGGAEPLRERATYKCTENVYTMRWLPDGRTLAVETSTQLKLLDGDAGKERRSFPIGTGVWRAGKPPIAFSADGSMFAAVDISEKSLSGIRVWDLATVREIRRLRGGVGETTALAFSPDGRALASGGDDWLVRLWELSSGAERATLKGHTLKARGYHAAGISWLAFSPDGRLLASAGVEPPTAAGMVQLEESAEFMLWDLAKRATRGETKIRPASRISVEWEADGKSVRLRWGTSQAGAEVMDALTGQRQQALPGEAHLLARAPDGKIIIDGEKSMFDKSVGYRRSSVELWDTGKRVAQLPDYMDMVNEVAFHPGGKLFVIAGWDATLRLWAYPSLKPLAVLKHPQSVRAAAWSPDGKWLASASEDGTVRIWEVAE